MVRLIFTTFSTSDDAAKVIRHLVEEGLAACGTILPGARSVYLWKGEVEDTTEAVVIFKTTVEAYPRFEARLKELHPYETPEIVAIDPAAVSGDYAAWVTALVNNPNLQP
jgi:periplasmic divalent cation tolerance protein